MGIAWGGDHKKHKVGEVLVASRIISYGSNTKVQGDAKEEHRDGTYEHLDSGWRDELHAALVHSKMVVPDEVVQKNNPHPKKPVKLEVHFGPVLSTGYLLKNAVRKAELMKYVKDHFPGEKVIGGDMESSSLGAAANNTNDNPLNWLWIKGICDHADEKKADGWQKCAAAGAADVLVQLLMRPELRTKLTP